MAYNEELGARLLAAVEDESDIVTRKMFGGLAVMWRGHMLAGVIGDELMVRVGPEAYEETLVLPGVREMDFTGKTMKGMVMVSPLEVAELAGVEQWVQRAKQFVGTLPPK